MGVAGASNPSTVAQARKALLVLSDMPPGWTSSSSGSQNNGSFPGAEQLASCLAVPADVLNSNAPTAYSQDFSSKNQQFMVADNVSIYPTARGARASFTTLANARTPGCITAFFNGTGKSILTSGAPAGASVGTVVVARTPASDYGPGTTNFTAFLPITHQEVVINSQVTVVDFVKGAEEQTVTLDSYGTGFPVSVSRHVTEVADGRT